MNRNNGQRFGKHFFLFSIFRDVDGLLSKEDILIQTCNMKVKSKI